MTYYYCDDCGEIFSEEDARVLWVSNGYGTTEEYACPSCRNTYIVDASTCEICGRPIPLGKHICDDCSQEMHKAWTGIVEKVMDLRLKENRGLSADYIDCEQGVMEYMREVGLVI